MTLAPRACACQHEPVDQYLWLLKDKERDLIREIEPDRLAKLDEEELLVLHRRMRKARRKHLTNYRRGAAEKVTEHGGRGTAAPHSDKARGRAYVFEEALSIVSAELARVAHEKAEQLRDERIAQARAGRGTGPASDGPESDGGVGPGRAVPHTKSPGGKKRDASSQAEGARNQAKHDSR